MRNKIFLSIMSIILISCDPPIQFLFVDNRSDEIIYIYFVEKECDSLPVSPKLELFEWRDSDIYGNFPEGLFSPIYRIDAYSSDDAKVFGFSFPELEDNKATIFFISEKIMREYSWEEISENQMYIKKTVFTKQELDKSNWRVTYKNEGVQKETVI